jgi:hypothetical protein
MSICSALAFKGVADLQPHDTVGLLAAAINCINGLQSVEGGLSLVNKLKINAGGREGVGWFAVWV